MENPYEQGGGGGVMGWEVIDTHAYTFTYICVHTAILSTNFSHFLLYSLLKLYD